jgi:transcriptional regulator with XRE-family HTH domain
MTDLYRHIASEIRRLRTAHNGRGISQDALAAELETSANTISRWETATYKPSVEELDRLAKFFNVPITTFFIRPEKSKDQRLDRLAPLVNKLAQQDFADLVGFAEFRIARPFGSIAMPNDDEEA